MSRQSSVLPFLLLLLIHLLSPVASRPQADAATDPVGEERQREELPGQAERTLHDPLKWIWLESSSVSLQWPARFSLSINGAVTAYSLSLTHQQHAHPYATSTLFHASTLRHQFEGLRSNVTYAGRLAALVGQHHWPYTLLNFTITSATLYTGLGLGQRAIPGRPRSTTADLDAITVGVMLRWSPAPFLRGHTPGPSVRPVGYRLRMWDQKQLLTEIVTSVTSHDQGCEAAVGGLSLDSVYKTTLEAVLPDGEPGTALSFSLDAGALHVAGGGLTTDGVSECYSGLQVRCPGSERCVSPYWICDGAPDCPDGDDEYACPTCDVGELRCPWGGACLQSNATCDGVVHCRDGWDESGAMCGSVTCGEGELRCFGAGRCVSRQRLCDGVPDCPASEDEDVTFCSTFNSLRDTTVTTSPTIENIVPCENRLIFERVNCTEEEFRCDSRSCVLREYLCDGISDCENGRDELPNACSLAPTEATKTPKFRFDSEEDFSDREQNMNSLERENDKCSGLEELCSDLSTDLTGAENTRERQSLTTEATQTPHSQDVLAPEEPYSALEPDNTIDNEIHDTKSSTVHTTTISSESSTEASVANVVHTNITQIGGNELDIDVNEYSNQLSLEENIKEDPSRAPSGVEAPDHDVMVEVEVSYSGYPETDLNLSSSEEYDYAEENFTLIMEKISPFDPRNLTSGANYTEDSKDLNGTVSLQKPIVQSDELSSEDSLSSEEEDANGNLTQPFLVSPEHNITTEDLEEESNTEDSHSSSEEDDITSPATGENVAIIQTMFTDEGMTGTETTAVEMTLLTKPEDGTSQTTESTAVDSDVVRGTPALGLPGTGVSSTTSPSSTGNPEITVSTDVTEVTEDIALYPRVIVMDNAGGSENLTTSEPDHPGDIISPIPDTTEKDDHTTTTSTTSSPTTTFPGDPHTVPTTHVQVHTVSTQETVLNHTKTLTTVATPPPESTPSPGPSLTTEPFTWKEKIEQKNLTILIAIHSGLNESEVPQYIIHGTDGNTYQYEIVSIMKDEEMEEKEKEKLNNLLEVEEEMTNEIRGDGSHQYLQGIHISSSTMYSSHGTSIFLLLLLLLFINIILGSDGI